MTINIQQRYQTRQPTDLMQYEIFRLFSGSTLVASGYWSLSSVDPASSLYDKTFEVDTVPTVLKPCEFRANKAGVSQGGTLKSISIFLGIEFLGTVKQYYKDQVIDDDLEQQWTLDYRTYIVDSPTDTIAETAEFSRSVLPVKTLTFTSAGVSIASSNENRNIRQSGKRYRVADFPGLINA